MTLRTVLIVLSLSASLHPSLQAVAPATGFNTTQLEKWTSLVIERCSEKLGSIFQSFAPTILERLQENFDYQMTHLPDMDPELATMARSMTLFEFWLLAYGQLTVQSRPHSELSCHGVLCGEEWRPDQVRVTVDDGAPCSRGGWSGTCENGICTSDRSALRN